MPPTLPGRRRSSHTSPRTSSVLLLTPSKQCVPLRQKARVSLLADSSAVGSASNSPKRYAIPSSTISDFETRSVGRCSTADGRNSLSALPNKHFTLPTTCNTYQFTRPNNRFQSDGLARPFLRVSSGYSAVPLYRTCLPQGRG